MNNYQIFLNSLAEHFLSKNDRADLYNLFWCGNMDGQLKEKLFITLEKSIREGRK